MSSVNPRTMEYYLGLDYPVQLLRHIQDDDVYWVAEIPDLPGCMADGLSPDEAIEHLSEAKQVWIDSCLEDGLEIPEPSKAYDHSGRFLLRLPKSLHKKLAREAKREGVSLNQLAVIELAGASKAGEAARETKSIVEDLGRRLDTLTEVCSLLMKRAEATERFGNLGLSAQDWIPDTNFTIFVSELGTAIHPLWQRQYEERHDPTSIAVG